MPTVYNTIVTVIIAALYDDGDGAIIVSDNMATFEHPFKKEEIRVEHDDIRKIFPINDTVTVAYTGNVEFWSEILKEVEQKVHKTDKYEKVRRIIETVYRRHFIRYLESNVLVFLGFENMKDYNARANKELPQARIDQIDHQLKTTIATGEMILVGKDKEVYEIYSLRDPGTLEPNIYGRTIVGSGVISGSAPVLLKYRKKMSKKDVKELLLEAKKLAEQDKGVGKLTQVVELP